MKFFFALLGVALASYSTLPTRQPLVPGNEYNYKFHGQISSGFPEGSETSNTLFNCDVRVQMVDDRSMVLGFDNWKLAASNKQVPTLKQISFESLEKREITVEHKQFLELPVAVSYRNGLISDLEFSREEPAWTANIKRSVINMLQLNLEKIGTRDTNSVEMESETDLVSVFEKTIEGDCEVLYNVVSGNKNTIVTKTPNFEKCSRRSDIRYHLRFSSECSECEHTREVVPQTVYTYKMEKEQLNEIEVRSMYQVNIVGQPLMKTEITTVLSLVESTPIRRMLKAPRGEKQELFYSTEWEEKIERFYKNGDSEEIIFEKPEEKMAEIKRVVKRIAEMKEQSAELVNPYTLLYRNVRQCSISELRELHESLYSKSNQKIKSVFEHALATSGTKNTIEHLIKLMRQEEISPAKAAQLFKSIQETLYPSESIAKMIHEFSRSDVSRRNPVLRQSVWLCYGAVVRGVVSPVMEKHLVKEDSLRIKNNFLSVFMKELENSESTYDRILIVKSLANAAIDVSVPELEKIILNKKEESVIRREAIDALRLLSEQMPRKVQRLLMPVFADRLEKPEIRMSALVQLLQTKPELTILSQIVVRMEREPNQHVAAMTYRMLDTISKSSNPCYRRLSSEMKTVLRTTLFRPENRIYSVYRHLPLFSHEFLSGMNVNFASVFGKDSIIPKELMASMETLVSGDWSKYFMQVSFTQQNLEQLYSKIVRSFERSIQKTDIETRDSSIESLNYLKKLAEKMNIKSRKTETEEPFVMLYFRYKQMDFAMLPMDEQLLDKLVSKFLRNGAVDSRMIEGLFNIEPEFNFFHAASFLEHTYQVPTILGVPLLMITTAPTTFSVEGKMSLEKMLYGARVRFNAKPSSATTLLSLMKIQNPILDNGVIMMKKLELSLPLNFDVEFDYHKNAEVKLRFSSLKEKTDLVRVVAKTLVFYRNPNVDLYKLAPTEIMMVHIKEKSTQEIEYTTEALGHKVSLTGKSLNQWNLRSLLLEDNDLTLSVEPLRSTPREILVRLNVEAIKEGRFDKPQVEKMMDKDLEIEEESWNTRDHSSRREHIHKTTRDLVEGYKHRMTVSLEAGRKTSEIELRTEIQNELRFWRFLLNVRRPSTESSEWNMKSLLEVILPETVSTLQQLKDQKHREVLAHWETIWGAEDKNEMTMKLQLEPSKEQLRWVKSLGSKYEPMPELDLLVKAARLNQIKAVVDYNLSPKNEKYFGRWFETLKAYSFWYSKLEMVQGPAKRVALQVTLSPAQSNATLTIRTPEQVLEMTNVRLPMVVLPSIARVNPFSKTQLRKIISSECVVKSNKIDSFDNLVYRTPLTTCYSVVAKDCSEEPRFAVLVKKISKRGEEKKVKIVGDSIYELQLVDGKMIVSVNGKKIQHSSDIENFGIEKINENLWIIALDEVTVRFDGYTVKVELKKERMNTQCGLCGHFDGQKDNEFRTAYDDETEDIETFHRSYIVKHEECSMDEEELSNKKNYKVYEDEYEQYDEYSHKDYEEKRAPVSEKIEPVEVTRVIEINHRLCYSTEPITECPKNSITQRPIEKEIEFNCVSRDSTAARTIRTALARGPIRQPLSINSNHMSIVRRTVSIPRSCEVY